MKIFYFLLLSGSITREEKATCCRGINLLSIAAVCFNTDAGRTGIRFLLVLVIRPWRRMGRQMALPSGGGSDATRNVVVLQLLITA